MKTSEALRSFIHGRQILSNGKNDVYENFSPSTGAKIGSSYFATSAEIEEAIASSHEGYLRWSRYSLDERGKILHHAATLIRKYSEELAQLEVLDTGKPIAEARIADVEASAQVLAYFAGLATSLSGQYFALNPSFAYTRREPLGVCLGIGAWNYPLQIATWKSAAALACGNSMIYKPSELTPITSIRLAEIYSEAGIPDGVFNVILGGSYQGQLLAKNPKVKKISLTGSLETGKKVLQSASQDLKPVTLELGGKSPLIVFEDADIKQAVSGALLGNFYTQGEICSNGTRVFLYHTIYEAFLDQLLGRVKKIKLGDPFQEDTQMGSLISRAHLEKVERAIEDGKAEGAKLLCGGCRPEWSSENSRLNGGHFIEPAVFINCHDQMKLVQEEIFGPVMSILPFKTEEEVIARANQTNYGLAAGVFTQDLRRGHRVVEQLEAGICWINNYNITPPQVPFGGYKMSGIGRENGLAALEHYSQLKTIYVEMAEVQAPY